MALLTHLSPLFLLNSVKSAVPGVDRNDIHSVTAVLPPVPEQRAIACFLGRETDKVDQLIKKIEVVIHRLQEYRTALVTAVITGKIDVNGTDSCPGGLTPAEERQARSADFMSLWGAWPGDEPIEELLAQLRSSRRHAPDVSLNREIVDTDQ